MSAWPHNCIELGFVDYDDQAKLYGSAHFGLNVMRWQDDMGLNLKPFEIALSRTCLLQSYRSGIEDLYTKDEAIIFETPEECRQRVDWLLEHRDELMQVRDRGYERAVREHCWKNRATDVMRLFES